MTRIARTLVLPLLAIAVVGLAAPASAERVAFRDVSGDVFSPDGPRDWTTEGSVVNTDVRRTSLAHTDDVVALTVRYADLRKRATEAIEFSAYLRTDDRHGYEAIVHVDWLGRGASVILIDEVTQDRVECDGLAGKADFATDVVRAAVPRSCLGDPAWLRYAGAAESYRESDGSFVDSALSSTPDHDVWSTRVRTG